MRSRCRCHIFSHDVSRCHVLACAASSGTAGNAQEEPLFAIYYDEIEGSLFVYFGVVQVRFIERIKFKFRDLYVGPWIA